MLTEAQETFLKEKTQNIAENYDCGVYVVTIADYTKLNDEITDAVINLYHENLLGFGEERDGILLLMDPNNREFAFFVYGKNAEHIFDGYGQDLLEDVFLDDFGKDVWYDGFEDFVLECERYMALSAVGDPVRMDKTLFYAAVVVVSLVIAFVFCLIRLRGMKSVEDKTEAFDYIDFAGTSVAISEDKFLYVTRWETILSSGSDSDFDDSPSTSSFSRSGSF